MTGKKRKKLIKYIVEFVKLQLTGNILFWGTYISLLIFNKFLGWPELTAVAIGSIISHILFFIVNKQWVFNDKTGERKTSQEVIRFILFMGLNYFINLGIIGGLQYYFGITAYIGSFIAAGFFTFWSFLGLRFWVFQEVHHHSLRTKYVKEGKKRRATSTRTSRAKRRTTKRAPQQKAARAA